MKRSSVGLAVKVVIGLLAVVMLSATGAWASPTTPEQASIVVQNWLSQEAAPMNSRLGGQIREVQTFTGSDGNPAYYVVYLNPSGLVLVSADDLVEPIIGFVSGQTSYDPASRLGKLVSRDIPNRVAQARTATPQLMQQGTALAPQTAATSAQDKWALLSASSTTLKTATASPTVSAPLTAGAAPVISNIDPVAKGPGTFTVTLSGSNFTGVTSVTCFPASQNITWTFVSDSTITIQGNFPVGSYLFTVTTPNGSGTSPWLSVGIAPKINYISPILQPPGTFTVTLTGINFTPDLTFKCSDTTLNLTWNVVSATTITITGDFPVGDYTFTVLNPFGSATSPTMTVGQVGIPSVSDVRVAPFVFSSWGYDTLDGSQQTPPLPLSLPCYNYFTPPYPPGSDRNYLNYPFGTNATAQLMRFWQYPTTGVGTGRFTITVNGGISTWPLRGGEGLGGPYQWSNMPLDPINTPGLTDLQRQAIGNLCHDIDLSVNMDYEWNSYDGKKGYDGTNIYNMSDVAKALVSTFKYGNAMAGRNAGQDIPYDNRDKMIIPNLHAGYPVILSLFSTRGGDFIDVLCDGYGYNYNSIYHHLHIGYGVEDAWYNLPLAYQSTTDPKSQFNILTDVIYNVYPSGTGEIIAGRVMDSNGSPVSGATVTATRTGGGTYNATTNANGIYGIPKVPSASTYSVTVTKAGLTFPSKSVSTGTSATGTITSGNLWGVDFVPGSSPPSPPSPLSHALDNNVLPFSTSGNANWFEQTDTAIEVPYFGPSCAQCGAIAAGQISSLQTTVTGPGTLVFYWSASSYPFFPTPNKLILSLDGVAQDSISGVVGWTLKTLTIPTGTHTITWTYNKTTNQASQFYSDHVWVDKVSFSPPGLAAIRLLLQD